MLTVWQAERIAILQISGLLSSHWQVQHFSSEYFGHKVQATKSLNQSIRLTQLRMHSREDHLSANSPGSQRSPNRQNSRRLRTLGKVETKREIRGAAR